MTMVLANVCLDQQVSFEYAWFHEKMQYVQNDSNQQETQLTASFWAHVPVIFFPLSFSVPQPYLHAPSSAPVI